MKSLVEQLKLLTSVCVFSVALPGITLAQSQESILTGGDFEGVQLGGAGWPAANGVSIVDEDGNYFLRLEADAEGGQIQAYRRFPLPSNIPKLAISFRARHSQLTGGVENWHTGRVVMHFKDASGEVLKPDPAPFAFKGSSTGWVDKNVELVVPEGAASFEFFPALFFVPQGTLDIDDVVIAPTGF
jgi:hypothetical protein